MNTQKETQKEEISQKIFEVVWTKENWEYGEESFNEVMKEVMTDIEVFYFSMENSNSHEFRLFLIGTFFRQMRRY